MHSFETTLRPANQMWRVWACEHGRSKLAESRFESGLTYSLYAVPPIQLRKQMKTRFVIHTTSIRIGLVVAAIAWCAMSPLSAFASAFTFRVPAIGVRNGGSTTAAGAAATLGPMFPSYTADANVGSSSRTVYKLTNTGTVPLTLGAVSTSGPFTLVPRGTLQSSLAVGANQLFTLTFAPTTIGPVSGVVTVTTAEAGAISSAITGTGDNAVPVLSPSSLTFGPTVYGTSSGAQAVTLTNGGTTSLNITQIATGGNGFAQSNSCGSSLAPGASCSIAVTFTPASDAGGTSTSTLSVSAVTGTQTITVSGTSVTAEAQATYSPLYLVFGNQAVGTSSAPQSITITNLGAAPLPTSNLTPSTGFSATSACPPSLSYGQSCTVSVVFTPSAATSYMGTLSETSSTYDYTISIQGTGQ